MARYKAQGTWSFVREYGSFIVQEADALDTNNGQVFEGGASRVLDARIAAPVKGKGGTTPFFGESAWSAAERLASDLALKERYS